MEGYQIGQAVMGLGVGSLGSHAVASIHWLIAKPEGLSFIEAATIPTVFLTVYRALVALASLKPTEWILIHAGAGGVGLAAIQLAQYIGARIITTAGSEAKRAYLKGLGVTHVLDSRTLAYGKAILTITHQKGVDVVLNSLTGEGAIETTLSTCALGARFIEIGKRSIWTPAQMQKVRPDIHYHILALDEVMVQAPAIIQAGLQALLPLFEQRHLKPLPQTVYPLEQAIPAFQQLQRAQHIGKVVLTSTYTTNSVATLIDADANYLITGGLGGIGLQVAEALIKQGARHLTLVSRKVATPEVEQRLALLHQEAAIEVVAVDISHKEQVEALLNQLQVKPYPLKGIFHAAGVLADGAFINQDWQRFLKVYAPKVQGAWYLHNVTHTLNIALDHFVLFSSVTSVLGSPGQSNYSAANAFLDSLAHTRRQQGLPALSINWGPWSEGGMAASLITDQISRGFNALTPRQGVTALLRAMASFTPQILIADINWQRCIQKYPYMPVWLEEMVEKSPLSTPTTTGSFLHQLQGVPLPEREDFIKSYLRGALRKVLRVTEDAIDEQQGFAEMGMDSLMAMELRNQLQASMGKPLPATITFDYPNLVKLLEFIKPRLGVAITPAEPVEGVAPIVFQDWKERASPLMLAVSKGQERMVLGLLHRKAKINDPDSVGWTAFLVACYEGQVKMVELLLAHGADINQQTPEGLTPLDYAVSRGYTRVVRSLLARLPVIDPRVQHLTGDPEIKNLVNKAEGGLQELRGLPIDSPIQLLIRSRTQHGKPFYAHLTKAECQQLLSGSTPALKEFVEVYKEELVGKRETLARGNSLGFFANENANPFRHKQLERPKLGYSLSLDTVKVRGSHIQGVKRVIS